MTLRQSIEMLPLVGEPISGNRACLVHGIFGSGKSFLIAVLILTFVKMVKLSTNNSKSVGVLFLFIFKLYLIKSTDLSMEIIDFINNECCR